MGIHGQVDSGWVRLGEVCSGSVEQAVRQPIETGWRTFEVMLGRLLSVIQSNGSVRHSPSDWEMISIRWIRG